MPREVIDFLQPGGDAPIVDATVGLGGHAELILSAAPSTRLIGIDRDAETLEIARRRLAPFGDRVTLVQDDYRNLRGILGGLGLPAEGSLSGVLADLGLSSYQLAAEGRGFSFRRDEPLDMRMDRSAGRTAADLLADLGEKDLARLIFEYGEERHSRRIARAIVERRKRAPIRTTGDLVTIIESVVARRGQRIHPATRTFQALRIAVNQELEDLDKFVLDSVEALQAGGRLVLLTFHSLEDRLVKSSLRHLHHRCSCPRSLPRCACSTPDRIRVLNKKPLRPSIEEVATNPRSRSAKLRAAERI